MRPGISHTIAVAALAALAAATSCGPSSRYVVGYYPTWKRNALLNLDMSKITHLQLAFGIPTDEGTFTFDGEWFLPSLVREARSSNTKISLTIGGWTGSNRFSSIMQDVHKRGALVKSIGDFIEKYELDGAEIDWEYPGRAASKCNKFSPQDSANLLRFLHALRSNFHARFPDEQKLISLAVRVQPFDDANGPMSDVSPFAEFVDYASIMAFDINGVWANSTGPNAPFDYQHNRGLQLSYTQAIDQWLAAKWPADKLVAGVPFYGRSLTTREVIVAKDGADMYVPFANEVPQGDLDDALWYDVCENVNSMSGIWNYRHLRDQGLLRTANTTTDDWIRIWDHTSSTPWLYNPQLRRFITYDDQESLAKKVDYARNKGIKGMMVWALNGDYQNELISTLEAIGPLCRGPKTANDTEPDHQSSSAAAASSASPASTSSVPPASIGSASPAPASPEASSHSGPWTMPSLFSTGGSTSQQSSNNASEQSTSSPSVESHSENSSSAESPATTSEVSKAIMFDSVGVPYAIISGKSTAVPSDMADVLMKLGVESSSQTSASAATSTGESPVASMPSASAESGSAAQSSSISAESAESSPGSAAAAESAGSSTALSASSSAQPESTPNDTTGTSAELLAATSSISFPVPDSSDSTSPAGVQRGPMPRRPGWKSEINLFETMLPGGIMGGSGTGLPHPMSDRSMSVSQPGFAATFLLPLDTKSGTSNAQTATVLPLQQMIASRALEFNLGLSSSSKTEASGSGTISGNSGTVSSNGSSAESSSASAASSQTSPAPSS